MHKLNILSKLLIFLFLIPLTSFAENEVDVENWTFLGGFTKLGKTEFSFHSANFFAHDGDGYFLNHTQLSLDFPSAKSISLGIGYKQEYVDLPGLSNWRKEYRPMLHLYYTRKWGHFEFRDRSRWEFRFMEGDLIHRYRNQVQLTYLKSEKFIPYMYTEFSFYIDPLMYTRQRTVIGGIIPINKFALNLFLGHQYNEDLPEVWNHKIMLGTGLQYSF